MGVCYGCMDVWVVVEELGIGWMGVNGGTLEAG